MPYIPLHNICPAIAEKETRVISILKIDNEFHLPQGDYAFIELFCDECDCRRVILQVLKNQKLVATISYGWEKLAFYKNEFRGLNKKDIRELKGPALVSFQYQSEISDRVLNMFNELLLSDKAYLARIEKHYDEFQKTLKLFSN